ncbi:phosphoadenosine phosphosulfate reductase [Thermogymnomonas acidicola]|uniref:Adenosine 5'-phosphosulfate reductase n=2 Tax=Thermogymnomonas acidicola TaxID=399579 RepID=A0AA37F9F9_9ARCH|nr:phosphoadenosine phosphosulfate reductase [Thermogymnomonas acidicola]
MEGLEPPTLVREVWERFGDASVFTTSLGAEDMVILHMMSAMEVGMEVVTIDTGRLPEETYALIGEVERFLGIRVKVYFPDTGEVEEMVRRHGVNLFYDSAEKRHLCCYVRKVRVLERALKGRSAWVSGIRRGQTEARANTSRVEWDSVHGLWKFNPLADWSYQMVWAYIRENHVPYNALHDRGYRSIGCAPCTRAVREGEDERAGRWWWESGVKECGLHTGWVPADFRLGGR